MILLEKFIQPFGVDLSRLKDKHCEKIIMTLLKKIIQPFGMLLGSILLNLKIPAIQHTSDCAAILWCFLPNSPLDHFPQHGFIPERRNILT